MKQLSTIISLKVVSPDTDLIAQLEMVHGVYSAAMGNAGTG